MKGMHWWCYIGYEDLFKAVYHRPTNEEEQAHFKKMNREARNNWILEHIGWTNGIFVAMDQRADNGYIAFTTLPYFCKGIADGEIVVPEGKTDFVIPHDGSTKWGFTVIRTGGKYEVISWWDNSPTDRGQTTISMDENGDLSNYQVVSPKFKYPLKYNFSSNRFEPDI